MALLLALDNALLACVPSPGGGCALQPLGAPTAASAEALVALQSGKATIIDAGAFVAATAALPPSALVEATLGAALLGSSSRPLQGLPAFLDGCAGVVPGTPSLPARVVTTAAASPFAAEAAGASSSAGRGSGGACSAFELMYQLSRYSAAASQAPAIQLDPRPAGSGAAALQKPAPPAAALRTAGPASQLFVRWGATADEWCMFEQASGQLPSARCSCGFAGLGLLYCPHLAEAHRAVLGDAGDGAAAAAPPLLDAAALEAACSQMSGEQLAKLLLCTALYTGAGAVLTDGLSLAAAALAPPGGLAAAQGGAPASVTVEMLAALQAQGVVVGKQPLAPPPPGCAAGGWRAAAPAAAAAAAIGQPLLEHAASLLPPLTAEGVWGTLGITLGPTGLPMRGRSSSKPGSSRPSGAQLQQAAQLLLSVGKEECGECGLHILKEWFVALSVPTAWADCKPPPQAQLVPLLQRHLPAPALVQWWAQQTALPQGDGRGGQQRQRISSLCDVKFLELVEQLMGPVAGARLAADMLHGITRAAARGAALQAAVGSTYSTQYFLDATPSGTASQAVGWLGVAEEALGAGSTRELGQQLQRHLERAVGRQQPQAAPKKKGRARRGRRSGPGAGAGAGPSSTPAAGGAPAQQQPPAQQQQQPDSLLLTSARATAEQLLQLPLDEAEALWDRLVPELQELVLKEVAGHQLQLCKEVPLAWEAVSAALQQPQHGPAGMAGSSASPHAQHPSQQRPPLGLAVLLAAAAAPQPALLKQRLTLAACRCLTEQLGGSRSSAHRSMLVADGGASWRHLLQLVEQSAPGRCSQSRDLLPATLTATAVAMQLAREQADGSRQQQPKKKGGRGQPAGPPQPAAAAYPYVPAPTLQQLARLLPGLLAHCCAAASDALGGPSGSGSGSSRQSRVADVDALALALKGIHSCVQLLSEVFTAALSYHKPALAALIGEHPAPLLLPLPAVLAAAAAAGPAAAAAERSSAGATEPVFAWATILEFTAAELMVVLPKLPMPAYAGPGTTAADQAFNAAQEAYGGPGCLADLLPQLLETADALAHSSRCGPPRRSCMALLCGCLAQLVRPGAGSMPAVQQEQAGLAVLRLLVSPAAAYELQHDSLQVAATQQLAQTGFGFACKLLPALLGSAKGGAGASAELARLAGDAAYLAANLLARSAARDWSPLTALVQSSGRASSAANVAAAAGARQKLAAHAGWQIAALHLVNDWLELELPQPEAPSAATACAASGPPSLLFVCSTLLSLLSMAVEPRVHTAAVACLFCVMSRHRALPLRCDSLPLVVHAAAQRAYAMHASQQGAAAQQWTADDAALVRRVQGVLEEMLGWVRQEAAHAGPAGAAARAMWQLWEQHAPPAPAAAAGGAGGPAAKGGGIILGAAAAEWDRASSAAAALSGASLVRTAESGARLPYAAPPALNAGAHGYSALEAAQLRAAYEAGLMGEPFLGDEEEAYGAGSYDSMDEYGEDYLDYEDPFYESYGGYW